MGFKAIVVWIIIAAVCFLPVQNVKADDGRLERDLIQNLSSSISFETLSMPAYRIVPDMYSTIQSAIDASDDEDVVIVMPGVYAEKINFGGKNIIVTGIDPQDPNIVASTIITANHTGTTVTFNSGESLAAVLQGFTITDGTGTVEQISASTCRLGAGIYCKDSSPTIRNNAITGNSMSSEETTYGGAICLWNSDADVLNNTIFDNSCVAGGGIFSTAGQPYIAGNIIYNNESYYGGGICVIDTSTIVNNTVVKNEGTYGGNLYAYYAEIGNNIIAGAVSGGGIYYSEVTPTTDFSYNNVWGNIGGDYSQRFEHTGFNGNISADPNLANADANDFHILMDSPCINAGNPDFIAEADEPDMDGQDRIYSVKVDIGADEYYGYIKPVAVAGENQYLKQIQQVVLDGSGSFFFDANGLKEYRWTQISGQPVELSDANAASPSFMPPSEDIYVFELVVYDGAYYSFSDETTVVVGNQRPVADAGPNSCGVVGDRMYLDGSGSFDGDAADIISYRWSQIAGPNVVLYDANTVSPYFDCNQTGLYEFKLILNDGFEDSLADSVQFLGLIMMSEQQILAARFSTSNYFHYPDISGDRVVYSVGSACDFTWNIYSQLVNTSPTTNFSNGGVDTHAKIDGNFVVWFGGMNWGNPWYHEPSNSSITIRNIATSAQIPLRGYTWEKSYSHPAVSGKKVVWLEHLGIDPRPTGSSEANNWYNTPYNICGASVANFTRPVYFTIAQNVGRRDPYPCYTYAEDFDDVIDICGNIVVYEGNGDIYGADISDINNISVFTICDAPGKQYDPAISGRYVVWTDMRSDNGDIYGADIADINNIRIFKMVIGSGTQSQAAIDDGLVVYTSDNYLQAYKIVDGFGGLDVNITGSYTAFGPAVDAGKIIWQDDYYGKVQAISLNIWFDNDNDGMADDWEQSNGLDVNTNDAQLDLDGDGLVNIEEYTHKTKPNNPDTDGDLLTDYQEIITYHTNPLSADTDKDTMPDKWEVDFGTNPLVNDKTTDLDSDGLSNVNEYLKGCNPNDSDTDDDTMPDGWEVIYALNPILNDAADDKDGEGLVNLDEYLNNTNPNNSDTDSDTIPDKWEVDFGTNPTVNNGTADPDSDSLTNVNEYLKGCNPNDSDTDDDNMPDGWEFNNSLNPVLDDAAGDLDGDGLNNLTEYLNNANPNDSDSDDDGLNDGTEVNTLGTNPSSGDTDNDGLGDFSEVNQYSTNPKSSDTDSDGMNDKYEIDNNFNPLLDDANVDADNDGLTNVGEMLAGCNPYNPDTDNDKMKDGWEVSSGLNPIVDDAYADSDSDSYANLIEYVHHSLPKDANDLPTNITMNIPNDFNSISGAIGVCINGDTIVIQPGRYFEKIDLSDKRITITGTNPDDNDVVASTIIDANGLGSVITIDSNQNSGTVITGLTITGGNSYYGGGIYIKDANAVIEKNIIIDNYAISEAGGIYCENDHSVIRLNKISNNDSEFCGAVSCELSYALVSNNEIFRNTADLDSGIVCCEGRPIILNNTIAYNSATYDYDSSAIVIAATGQSPVIRNNIIAFNSGAAAVMVFEGLDTNLFTYNDVFGNTSGNYSGAASQTGINGNISVNPLFADSDSDDFHLLSSAGRWNPQTKHWVMDTSNSPCIDAADPADDLASELWPHGKRINMGAFGGTPQASMSTSNAGIIADFNNDDIVNGNDMLRLTQQWLTTQNLLTEDLNRDGTVNMTDFAIFADYWLIN